MTTLWIFETHRQDFLDDCKKYMVYGVSDPGRLGVTAIAVNDLVLIRLKVKNTNEYGYLGPFVASSRGQDWASAIIKQDGIWKQIAPAPISSPRWLGKFPWCVFLDQSENYLGDLRTLRVAHSIPACRPITGKAADEIIANLIQYEYLPISKLGTFRTLRGVWVRSRAEYMIDNWFTEHEIVTYYERAIYHNSIRIVPDWYIPSIKTYVEFLGLKGDRQYDDTWAKKEEAYKACGIDCVTLEDRDLADLDRSIPQKLPELRKRGIR